MKTKIDYNSSGLLKIIQGFKVYYIVYLELAFNAFINASPILDILTYITALVGSSLAICQVILYKETMRSKFFWIQIAFLISYVLSAAINYSYGYIDNAKTVIWTALPLILLYCNSFLLNETNLNKDFKFISVTYIILISINNIFSLSMLFWGYMYDFIDQTGTARAIGFRWDRLWGVYDDPNHGATISVVAVLLSLYLYKIAVKNQQKVLLLLSGIIQILYIIFSDSRTGLIALVVGVVIWGIFNFKNKKLSKYKWSSIAITAVVVVLLMFSDVMVKNLYEGKFFINTVKVTRTKTSHDADKKKNESARRKDTEENKTSGRAEIWSSGLDIFVTTPIVGTSYRNLTNYALAKMPDTYIVKTDWMRYDSMHNMPLDILVSQGIVGIVIFGAFGIIVIIYLVKRKAWRYLSKSPVFTCAACIVVSMLISSMFMSIIYFVHCPQTYMFWLSFGVCISIIEKDSKGKALSD